MNNILIILDNCYLFDDDGYGDGYEGENGDGYGCGNRNGNGDGYSYVYSNGYIEEDVLF